MDQAAIDRILAAARGRGAVRLSELEALELMSAAGIPVAEARMTRTVEEAVAAGEALGWPVVCKVMAPAISHKTEADGVHTGVRDADGVREAWRRIHAGAARTHPDATVEGVLVQRQGRGSAELIAGMSREAGFGPLVMFGLGGTLVEVLRDVVFRLAPVTPLEAEDMLEGIRGRSILAGPRGAPPADRPALVEVLVRIGQLAADYPEIAAVDLNPVLALSAGCLAVDARVALTPPAAPPGPVPER